MADCLVGTSLNSFWPEVLLKNNRALVARLHCHAPSPKKHPTQLKEKALYQKVQKAFISNKRCCLCLDAPQAKLQRLNEIVWPEIWRLAEEKIRQAHTEGYRMCIIDAAVLLKAGWDKYIHEVWVAIAPEKEVRDATDCGCTVTCPKSGFLEMVHGIPLP